ncbi:hypothetical protein KIH87_07015 [Paraneptunicella aestuarii]|uniref:glutaredoxin domain-containing protein n=1 Tax=Paraneptunicella aestuarii TaxID=2831148 RepID=UPI001E2D78DE|nr:glutaredoxin domain-containing protein [Paraneptunicella aestuarii]UAA40093.1 hypothetical protein KIH87_07015 [Paraneptunicella aestuarii]
MLKTVLSYGLYLIVGLAIGIGASKGYQWMTAASEYTIGDFAEYHAVNNSKVIVLGTAWCKYCAKTRRLFESLNVEYQDYDVEKNSQYQSIYQELGAGPVPIILIDDVKIVGFRKEIIMQFLTAKGLHQG